MSESITNHELRITNAGAFGAVRILLLLCVFCAFAGNIFSQTNLAEQILRGSDEQKRDALIQIRNVKTADAARLAVPALKDKSETVRAAAAFSVIALPENESLENLLPLLKDKKELVRREAALALGETANTGAINFLVQTFQTDKISDVRNACVVALGEIGDAAAIDFLTKILRRKPEAEEEFLRRAAARSVGQIAQIIQTGKREVLTPENFLPGNVNQAARPRNAKLIETFPAFRPAQDSLIEILQNAREAADARREAAFALGAIGAAAALPVLRANLNAEDYYLAQICKEAAGKVAAGSF